MAESSAIAPPETPLWETYAAQFPVAKRLIYLNHAAVAPLSKPAADAMRWLVEDNELNGSLHFDRWLAAYAGLRGCSARLINADASEIAIVKNTSEGIATVANGFDWKPGDRAVVFNEEFPANFYPWQRLAARGVQLDAMSVHDPLDRIEQAVKGARLLAISFVQYLSGYRAPIAEIGAICARHGCFFFVDAIQGLGAFPLDVERCRIDALAADGHKWLVAPEGCGILYVRSEWLDRIDPVEFGYTNVANPANYGERTDKLRAGAARYEPGTLNTAGIFGLRASIDLLLEVGIGGIAEVLIALTDQIGAGARGRGYEVMWHGTAATGSGIISIRHPRIAAGVLYGTLKDRRIVASPRSGWLRLSPHFYVSPDAIDEFLDALPPV